MGIRKKDGGQISVQNDIYRAKNEKTQISWQRETSRMVAKLAEEVGKRWQKTDRESRGRRGDVEQFNSEQDGSELTERKQWKTIQMLSKMADELTERKHRKTRQILNKIIVSKMADKLTKRKQRKTRQMLNKIPTIS
jgi:hypothetical protein